MNYFLPAVAIFFLTIHMVGAETYQVGPTRTYISPHALYLAGVLNDGDIIEIDGGNYLGTACLANWQQNNLIIQGVNGRPHLQANGQYILGKGIWVFSGNNITVENIEFSGTTVPSKNGAGIRLDGIGMTVKNCYFHDNENGILATSGSVDGQILVEHTEFAFNGYGDGLSHNIYVNNANKLIFRFNYSHHADVGHNLKSRADTNYIYCNRIMDEESGNSSRLIDLPNGGPAVVVGNLLMQGNNAPNNNLVGYGLEGLSSPVPHDLYFVNNTCVNKSLASCRFLQVQSGTSLVHYTNNIFTGGGTILTGSASSTTVEGNVIDATISNLKFTDEPNYDYHLESGSPAIDAGEPQTNAHGFSLTPTHSYKHKAQQETRTLEGLKIDAGAYEQGSALPVELISFQGRREENRVSLRWQTGFERNNSGFEIWRGPNIGGLAKMGWIPVVTSYAHGQNYSFTDDQPIKGANFYQLYQIDHDGTSWKSEIIVVEMTKGWHAFPNPARDYLILPEQNQTWSLYNTEGEAMHMPIIHGNRLPVGFLRPGIYYLRSHSGTSFSFYKQ